MTRPIIVPQAAAAGNLTLPTDGDVDALLQFAITHHRACEAGREWVKRAERICLAEAIAVGEALHLIKAIVGHGEWSKWQAQHLRGIISGRSVRDYMFLAKHRGQIGDAASMREAHAVIKRADHMAKCKALRDPGPLPCGRFNLIAIDIPWWFTGNWLPYKTMPREQVLALMAELEKRVADDATAFFWFPDKFLGDVIPVIEAAGFEYRERVLVWVKNGRAPHSDVMGGHELIAMATRGKSARDPGSDTVIHAPRGAHSEKPDAAYERFARIAPSNPSTRLELFARKPRTGWVTWGDQLPAEPEPEPQAKSASAPLALPAPTNPA